jgi:putative colanic acid biosysnthesis UDP-glucose lipid carrier transferase
LTIRWSSVQLAALPCLLSLTAESFCVIPQTTPIRVHRIWSDACLPALDACSIVTSLAAIRIAAGDTIEQTTLLLAMVATVVFLVIAQITGLHRQPRALTADQEMRLVTTTWLLSVVVLAVVALAGRWGDLYARSELFTWFILAPAMIGICRMLGRIVGQACIDNGVGMRRVAIAGFNPLGRKVAVQLESDAGLGWQLQGFYDDRDRSRDESCEQEHSPLLAGDLDQLIERARSGEVDTVLITMPMRAEQRIRSILTELSDSTVSVYIVPDIFVFELLHARWTNVGHLPAVSIFENPLDGVDGIAKRLTDLTIASISLVLLAVPMFAIGLAVKLTSPGPVFFRQRRYGLDGREIRVWKFRSMRTCDDGATVKQATQGDPRVTRIGAFLRKTSLDELPQLFNVVGGSMSLVGPRPHATAHNEEYRRQILGYMLRHKVKPGITGLAQVSGCRGETDTLDKMQRRIEFDHQYIRGWSFWLDLKILYRTLRVVWRQSEAY